MTDKKWVAEINENNQETKALSTKIPHQETQAPERRKFLKQAAALSTAVVSASAIAAENLPPNVPDWQKTLGSPVNTNPYGLPLKYLLDEAGVKPEGKWLYAEGADAASMSRSIPMHSIR